MKAYPFDASKKFFTRDWTGSNFFYENIAGETILVYNADAHEYFYGVYDSEKYHAFCHIIGSWFAYFMYYFPEFSIQITQV